MEVFIGTILGTVIFSDRLQIQSLSIEARQLTNKERKKGQTYRQRCHQTIRQFKEKQIKTQTDGHAENLKKGGNITQLQ